MTDKDIVIVGSARTPIGRFEGALATLSAPQLGAVAIRAAIERASLVSNDVDEVIMGQVITAGVGQAPARQAAIGAGVPHAVPATTVNKVCGSGLKAVMIARQQLAIGEVKVVVAGGMESMTGAPYLLPGARQGYRMGPKQAVDSMIHDGLWDPYGDIHMGHLGDLCATERDFSREQQDEYARESYTRAIAAQAIGAFDDEIVPVQVRTRKDTIEVAKDEEPAQFNPEKMSHLRPSFSSEGSVTPANASKISDGAAAVVLMSRGEAERRGCPVLATIVADATHAQDPNWFTTAPPVAIRAAADRGGLTVADIDLFEINEAFAVVVLSAMRELELNYDKVNVHGGAISLGHPIGCSGTRTLVTLMGALERHDKQLGCAALCIGGGEAVSMIVRREGS